MNTKMGVPLNSPEPLSPLGTGLGSMSDADEPHKAILKEIAILYEQQVTELELSAMLRMDNTNN